jgi:hypothetical protein
MGTKVAAFAAVALAAGIFGVSYPIHARTEPRHPKPISEPLRNLLETGADRAAGFQDEGSFCGWLRGFVGRYGRDRAIEIARLKYSDAVIEAARRACMPEARPIGRRSE